MEKYLKPHTKSASNILQLFSCLPAETRPLKSTLFRFPRSRSPPILIVVCAICSSFFFSLTLFPCVWSWFLFDLHLFPCFAHSQSHSVGKIAKWIEAEFHNNRKAAEGKKLDVAVISSHFSILPLFAATYAVIIVIATVNRLPACRVSHSFSRDSFILFWFLCAFCRMRCYFTPIFAHPWLDSPFKDFITTYRLWNEHRAYNTTVYSGSDCFISATAHYMIWC